MLHCIELLCVSGRLPPDFGMLNMHARLFDTRCSDHCTQQTKNADSEAPDQLCILTVGLSGPSEQSIATVRVLSSKWRPTLERCENAKRFRLGETPPASGRGYKDLVCGQRRSCCWLATGDYRAFVCASVPNSIRSSRPHQELYIYII